MFLLKTKASPEKNHQPKFIAFNYVFWPKRSMKIVFKKIVKFRKSFDVIEEIKILKLARYRDELQANIYSHRQSRAKY